MATYIIPRFDRAIPLLLADCLAVAVAVSLPWSTSAVQICGVLWLFTVALALDVAAIKYELKTAAGGLPVVLWCLGVIGMLWADVGWSERLQGLGSFHRLLIIPLLFAQFRRSGHGWWVLYGFLISSLGVLLVSYVVLLTPGSTCCANGLGVPKHDDNYQSSAFMICAFAALGAAGDESGRRPWINRLGLVVIAVLFLANFAFVGLFSRISLAVAPVLAGLLGWRRFGWKGIAGACVIVAITSAAVWFASPSFRARVQDSLDEFYQYRATNQPTPIGLHAAFLIESLKIVASAPIIGHGTGSIPDEFRKVTAHGIGAGADATVNPHNQTFAIAIQIGLCGAIVLWSMWIAHFLLFRGEGIVAWIGTVIVVENVVSSLVHSHLFDFANGWLYVFGVGVAGGMVLRQRAVVT
jgi:O-antigen ligase